MFVVGSGERVWTRSKGLTGTPGVNLINRWRQAMQTSRFSLRTTIIGILVLMSMALVVMSWETYRTLALDNQRQALSELVEYEKDEVFEHLEDSLRDVGYAAQHATAFRRVFANRDQ